MTSVGPSVLASTDAPRASLKNWLGVASVAVGIFVLVTSELMPVGLLTSISTTLRVSDGTAGLMVTVPGIVAAVAAPVVAVAAGRLDRRWVLCALFGLMAVANLASAYVPNLPAMLVARLLVGLSIGGFWVIAGGLAIRLVPHGSTSRATSIIFGGVSVASVVGVPSATAIGELSSWRTAFASLGFLGLAVLAALGMLLPSLPASQVVKAHELPRLFGNIGVRIGVTVTFFLVTGQFAAYTFVSPVLQHLSGISPQLMSTLLLAYGGAGVFGNFAAGWAAARDVCRTLFLITAALTVVMVMVPVLGGGKIAASGLVVIWGLSYGGVAVTLQAWIFKAAPEAPEAASALFVSVFNLSISFGALVGGLAENLVAAPGVMWLAGFLMAATSVAAWSARKKITY